VHDAAVLRTSSFHDVVRQIDKSQFPDSLSLLLALRSQFESDALSAVEIDRWVAKVYFKMGKSEDALVLLKALEPRLRHLHFEMSIHYLAMVDVLQVQGGCNAIQKYCAGIGGELEARHALDHLDWISRYADLCPESPPTDFMHTVLLVCLSQLGLNIPTSKTTPCEFRGLLTECIAARDRANLRFAAFWDALEAHRPTDTQRTPTMDLIADFIQQEPCPLFRELAGGAVIKTSNCLPDQGGGVG
jgi:hypothetical protein